MPMGKYNTAEIEAALKTITILVDTREKVWGHIEAGFHALGCPYVLREGGLKFGDYSYEYITPDGARVSCENIIVVERKANAEELSGNLTGKRRQFAAEFEKARAAGAKVYLLIENCNWGKIDSHDYRTNLNAAAFETSLWSWMTKYDLRLQFCNSSFTAKLIYGIFRYHLRAMLEEKEEEGDSADA